MLAAALEARQALGCAGLAWLATAPFDWLRNGPVETRRRIWRVLLPTLEEAPSPRLEMAQREDAILHGVAEHGAPRLKRLEINKPVMVRCLPRMPALESLEVGHQAMQGIYLGLFKEAVAAAGGPERFLPALKKLAATVNSHGGVEWLFRPLGAGHFAGVKTLRLTFGDRPPRFGIMPSQPKPFPRHAGAELGRALAAGAFASLERLELGLRMEWDAACSLRGLRAALFHAPCARSLRLLKVYQGSLPSSTSGGGAGGFLKAVGAALADGRLPALVTLNLFDNEICVDSVRELLAPLSAEKPLALQELILERTDLGDKGVAEVAAALEEGRLGSELRVLKLGGRRADRGQITEEEASRLRQALERGARHVRRLEALEVVVPDMTRDAVEGFVRAVISCLRALKRLVIRSGRVADQEMGLLMKAAKDLAGGKKGVLNIGMVYGYQWHGDW